MIHRTSTRPAWEVRFADIPRLGPEVSDDDLTTMLCRTLPLVRDRPADELDVALRTVARRVTPTTGSGVTPTSVAIASAHDRGGVLGRAAGLAAAVLHLDETWPFHAALTAEATARSYATGGLDGVAPLLTAIPSNHYLRPWRELHDGWPEPAARWLAHLWAQTSRAVVLLGTPGGPALCDRLLEEIRAFRGPVDRPLPTPVVARFLGDPRLPWPLPPDAEPVPRSGDHRGPTLPGELGDGA